MVATSCERTHTLPPPVQQEGAADECLAPMAVRAADAAVHYCHNNDIVHGSFEFLLFCGRGSRQGKPEVVGERCDYGRHIFLNRIL